MVYFVFKFVYLLLTAALTGPCAEMLDNFRVGAHPRGHGAYDTALECWMGVADVADAPVTGVVRRENTNVGILTMAACCGRTELLVNLVMRLIVTRYLREIPAELELVSNVRASACRTQHRTRCQADLLILPLASEPHAFDVAMRVNLSLLGLQAFQVVDPLFEGLDDLLMVPDIGGRVLHTPTVGACNSPPTPQ